MPELDLGDKRDQNGLFILLPEAPPRLFAAMIYPNQPDRREELVATSMHIDHSKPPAEGLRQEDPMSRLALDLVGNKDANLRGSMAGHILSLIYRMAKHHREREASVKKAVFITRKCLKQQSGVPFGRRFLMDSWSGFKPVAHLWGAFDLIHTANPVYTDEDKSLAYLADLITDKIGFVKFLALAAHLQEFGLRQGTRRFKTILDRDEIWRVPQRYIEGVDVSVDIVPLAGTELAAHQIYRASKQ